jgi:hypothetical protein
MDQIPKRIKSALRRLAGEAHEEELRRALVPLSDAFQRWRRGDLPSGELTDLIHRFHQGPARDLWVRYNSRMLEPVVAYAIVTGVLDRTKVPPEVLDFLARAIQFYESEERDVPKKPGRPTG